MNNLWYESSRKAAVMRLVRADTPLDGIYYWVPTPRGWDILTWYLESSPGETEDDRQQKFNKIKHENVWVEVLSLLHQKFGVPESLLRPIRDRFDTFPRGRVYRNRIGCGYTESQKVPNALERVCRAFNRTPTKVVQVFDEHWDSDPKLSDTIVDFLESPKLSNKTEPLSRTFRPSVRIDDVYVERALAEIGQTGVKAGLYQAGSPDNLYVDHDGQVFLKEIVRVGELTLRWHASPEEIEKAKVELENRTNNYPVVYRNGTEVLVRMNEARVQAAEQLGLERLYVWYNIGTFV